MISHSKFPPLALLVLVSLHLGSLSHAWIQSGSLAPSRLDHSPSIHFRTSTTSSSLLRATDDDNNSNRGPLASIFSPYDSKIPPELQDEIYAAEANTPAAQQRGARVALYSLLAFMGILLAFFNAFITELRSSPLPEGAVEGTDPLVVAGFAWVASNPITGFLFMNKIGGGICLLGGAGAGLLAEAELDTKRINAEKIFEEMQRRRAQKEKGGGSSRSKKGGQPQQQQQRKKKKRRSGKEKKRIQALSEIVEREEETTTTPAPVEAAAVEPEPQVSKEKEASKEEGGDGLLGTLKGFYDKADSMAASQALLLNKELEDRGMIEKITDETGLKVIGKEEAAKLQEEKQKEASKKD